MDLWEFIWLLERPIQFQVQSEDTCLSVAKRLTKNPGFGLAAICINTFDGTTIFIQNGKVTSR